MYKKIFISLLVFILISGCSAPLVNNEDKVTKEYIKGVWLTYYELSELMNGREEAEFEKEISTAFKDLSKKGFNRVTVQVRPFSDAFYNSSYFPVSAYCFGQQGSELKFDPLEIMCSAAEKYKLSIEAWINPYRVSNSADFDMLSDNNPAVLWKDTENVIAIDSGIYYNPASKEVRELIINGVKEIVDNYSVLSICFDDYFYPSKDESIDEVSYNDYVENGGDLSLADWRRDNVNTLIKDTYSAIKSINENITFGISPAANISNDYNNLYADVELWSTNEGYVDYINPQIYFGFQNENQPFMKTAKEWSKTADCDLYVSLPLYKTGLEDEFAGEGGMLEFTENNNIVSRQIVYLSKLEGVDGFYIFSYSFLNDSEEAENVYSAMQLSPE